MRQRLLAILLHHANADPPWPRVEFYAIKERLLRRYGRITDYEWQEIRKECWGPWGREYGERQGCQGAKCPHCRGTGVFDIRWVNLERWEWSGHVFHRPHWSTRTPPAVGTVKFFGRIEHNANHQKSREAALWLYLLCGEWRVFWNTLRYSCCCTRRAYPMLWLQWAVMNMSMWLSWRRCWCGRWFPTWGSGWQCCRRCRKPRRIEIEETPF